MNKEGRDAEIHPHLPTAVQELRACFLFSPTIQLGNMGQAVIRALLLAQALLHDVTPCRAAPYGAMLHPKSSSSKQMRRKDRLDGALGHLMWCLI